MKKSKTLWEVPPSESVEGDIQNFEQYFTGQSVIDVGCGTGEDAIALAKKFPRVLGLDVSKRAIRIAEGRDISDPSLDISWAVTDLTIPEEVMRLVEEWGQGNVYMRGVLHQIRFEDRPIFIKSLLSLCPIGGYIYLNEVRPGLQDYLEKEYDFDDLPDSMKQVFESDFPPLGVSIEDVNKGFGKECEIMGQWETHLNSNLTTQRGQHLQIPSTAWLLRRKTYL